MNRRLSLYRFLLRSVLLPVVVCAVLLWVWLNWEYFPGTYYLDSNGVSHGTGTTTCDYDSGQLMLKEWYCGGLMTKAIWYRPDGTEIATEEFDKQTGGIGYYLRQDGTIKSKCKYSYSPQDHIYLADEVTLYSADGTIDQVVDYDD